MSTLDSEPNNQLNSQIQLLGILKLAYLRQKLSHALIFIGSKSSGGRALAEALAGQILNVSPAKLGTQPDFIALVCATGKNSLGIDAVIELNRQLRLSSLLIGPKVAIIDGLETLTIEASNALLKTLEEPARNTFIIMLAAKERVVLPTILSRASKFYLPSSAPQLKSEFSDLFKQHFGLRLAWLNKHLVNLSSGLEASTTANQILTDLAEQSLLASLNPVQTKIILERSLEAQLAILKNKVPPKIAVEMALSGW